MKKSPNDDERLNFKLFFGLVEGSASGPSGVKCAFILALAVLIGKAIQLW